MITAGEPQEFIPFGRDHLKIHPGDVYLLNENVPVVQATANGHSLTRDILKALRGVSLKDQGKVLNSLDLVLFKYVHFKNCKICFWLKKLLILHSCSKMCKLD